MAINPTGVNPNVTKPSSPNTQPLATQAAPPASSATPVAARDQVVGGAPTKDFTAISAQTAAGTPVEALPNSEALWGLKQTSNTSGGAPLLADVPDSQVMPQSVLNMPPVQRHLYFFKVANQLNGQDASSIPLDPSKDHTLSFNDLVGGMQKLGITGPGAYALSAGVLLDRGGRQLLKGEGGFNSIDISDPSLWSTGHQDSARSGVYDDNGNVDPQREQQFLQQLDPNNTGRITMDQFKAVGQQLADQRDTGSSPLDAFKRWNDSGTFDRAWNSFMTIAGHTDSATGQKYVTPNDVKWFFDGSYFFRLAQARAQAGQS